MADLSDVTARMCEIIESALFPNGVGEAGVSGPAIIYEGWPQPDDLDADLAGKAADPATGKLLAVPNWLGPRSHVSVYPQAGAGATVQSFEPDQVVIPAVHNIAGTVAGQTASFTGAPGETEFVSLIVDGRHAYSRGGATLAAIMAALLTDVQADYPAATGTGTSITVPNASTLVARIGAAAVMGRQVHRQKQQIMVTVWAQSPNERTALAAAIDLAFKSDIRLTLPDHSQAIIVFERTFPTDEGQLYRIYRRDLVYTVEYATVELFDAYEITTVNAVLNDTTTIVN